MRSYEARRMVLGRSVISRDRAYLSRWLGLCICNVSMEENWNLIKTLQGSSFRL